LAGPLYCVETLDLMTPLYFAQAGDVQQGAGHLGKTSLLTTTHSTPKNRRKPSASEKGGSGVFSDYGNPTRAHAEEGQAERSGQAARSGEGGFGGSLRLRQSNSHARRRRPSRAQRPGQAERNGEEGFGSLLRLRHNTARLRAEESQAQWRSRAQRSRGFEGPS
jgi:hypothetical protein